MQGSEQEKEPNNPSAQDEPEAAPDSDANPSVKNLCDLLVSASRKQGTGVTPPRIRSELKGTRSEIVANRRK